MISQQVENLIIKFGSLIVDDISQWLALHVVVSQGWTVGGYVNMLACHGQLISRLVEQQPAGQILSISYDYKTTNEFKCMVGRDSLYIITIGSKLIDFSTITLFMVIEYNNNK